MALSHPLNVPHHSYMCTYILKASNYFPSKSLDKCESYVDILDKLGCSTEDAIEKGSLEITKFIYTHRNLELLNDKSKIFEASIKANDVNTFNVIQ